MNNRTLVRGVRALALAVLVAGAGIPLAQAAPPAPPAPPAASADVVRTWNDIALQAVRRNRASDAQAARLYAMVDVAMYDAVNGVTPRPWRYDEALVAAPADTTGDARSAAAKAAHDVLVAVYPRDAIEHFDGQLEADLSAATSPGLGKRGEAWGAHVAAAVVEARRNDGSAPNETQTGSGIAGRFSDNWSGVQFQRLAPFAIADSSVYFGAPPPALSSPEYAAAWDEVRREGSATPADTAKSATFSFWALATGTGQPPGAWVQVADSVSADQDLSLHETARLLALTTMAMADTVAPTVWTKATYHFWRPFWAIRRAAEDNNPLTDADTSWVQRANNIGTSPEYWSGHSSFSAAGATTLAGFFCTDDVTFSLESDSGGGAVRSWSSFSDAAAEAGYSRVVGGLHFPFSNEAGLAAGRAVADEVLAGSLLPPSGTAPCP